jgi:hypothetical protein
VEGFLHVGRGEKFGFKKDSKFSHKKARHWHVPNTLKDSNVSPE